MANSQFGLRNPRISKLLRHTVVRNVLGLSTLQLVNQVMPLVTVPVLARILRPDGWGEVLFVQSFAAWLAILLEYGFSYSATRSIARSVAANEPAAHIVSGVFGAKLLLSLACLVIMAVLIAAVPAVGQHSGYLWLAWVGAIAQGFLPLWYFQGKQRLTQIAIASVFARVLVTVVTILWVQSADDGWKVLLVQAVGNVVLSIVCLAWMYRDVPFEWPSRFDVRNAFALGWPTFIFSLSASLYSTANGFVLGLRSTSTQVAYYGGAEKTHRAFLTPFGPLGQALYPHMVDTVARDMKRAKTNALRSLLLMGTAGVVLGVLAFVLAPVWVRILLGANYGESVGVLQIMAIQLPMTGVSRVLGLQWMMPLHMDSTLNVIVTAGGVANLLMAFFLASSLGARGMALAFVVTETLITVLMFIAIQRSSHALFGAAPANPQKAG